MAAMLTNLMKDNVDAQRRAEHPDITYIELQLKEDSSRAQAQIVRVTEGWMFHREVLNEEDGRRTNRLILTENAVTNAVDATLTYNNVMELLHTVVVGNDRFKCREPVPPRSEPRFYAVECEWLGVIS